MAGVARGCVLDDIADELEFLFPAELEEMIRYLVFIDTVRRFLITNAVGIVNPWKVNG